MSLPAISSLESARDKKIFLELDEHHIKKVGIKRLFAQEAKMNVTAIRSLPIGEKKIFHELDVHHV